jgi:hypothetical protein
MVLTHSRMRSKTRKKTTMQMDVGPGHSFGICHSLLILLMFGRIIQWMTMDQKKRQKRVQPTLIAGSTPCTMSRMAQFLPQMCSVCPYLLCIVALTLPEICGPLSHDTQEIIQNPDFPYFGQATCLKQIFMSVYEGAV